MNRDILKKTLLWAIFTSALIGISLDVYNNSDGGDILKGLSNFKFFTLQSNGLILIYAFVSIFFKRYNSINVFNNTLGPVTSYIVLTGVVYLIILEPIYELYGMERLSSTILHYITPPLMFLFWVLFEERRYSYGEFFRWLIYPLVFMAWGLFRALVFNDYLYPFFDIQKYGLFVSAYLLMVAIGFSCMILLLIFINNNYLTNRRGAKRVKKRV
ncbi:MAG: Pr6Pr family membrane protein [Bacteroidales bacterium]|nr:Pr6Pr family membrane protein [Bacteroidales bacterium]